MHGGRSPHPQAGEKGFSALHGSLNKKDKQAMHRHGRKEPEPPAGARCTRAPWKEMDQAVLDFLSGEEADGVPAVDEDLEEWKKRKSEARARMAALQALP